MVGMVQLVRRLGFDPDPGNLQLGMTAIVAQGPDLTDEQVINLRYLAPRDRGVCT